jgi:hypothetical protein
MYLFPCKICVSLPIGISDYGLAMTDWTENSKTGQKRKDGGVPPNNANQISNGHENCYTPKVKQ